MSKLVSIRVPDSLYKELSDYSKKENVTISKTIIDLLAKAIILKDDKLDRYKKLTK